ncbi:unnamed protein product, partial [Polarella glacialis]
AALGLLRSLQRWLSNQSNNLSCSSIGVQLHARTAELRRLRAEVVAEFAQSIQLFQVFPLSFEDTQATEAASKISDFVQDVESFRSYTGASQVSIVGHSMGAAIALQHATTPSH